jgi:Transcriptional regulator, AbiEi antitoxin
VLALAEEQAGLVTRQQVQAAGVAWSTLSRQAGSGGLERVAHGVYRVRGGELPDHLRLRAAWLQLAPELPTWRRTPAEGVVSHRSAALLFGLGDLPADVHEFTLPVRRQSRRADVRLHRRPLGPDEVRWRLGLLATRPGRTAADLLADGESPDSVAAVVAEALRAGLDSPRQVADAVAVRARPLGLIPGDGVGLLGWLLDLSGDPDRERWLAEATA